MGAIAVPAAGSVYFDANTIIYSVERHADYWPLLEPVWQAAKGNALEIVSSDLTLLEVLVAPLKSGDAALVAAYEQLFQQPQTRLIPISQSILRDAARLRATTNLKTPDAVHASTAQSTGCVLFITNDVSFRNVPSLPTVVLNALLKP